MTSEYQFDDLTPLHPCSVSHPVSYSFRFKVGWAIFTVNDETGEFSIQSDWGDYAYRWNTDALGERTLTEFLKTDPAYITNKLSYGRKPELEDVFDEEGTKIHVVKVVREQMQEISIDERRQLELDLRETLQFDADEDDFMESIDKCRVANRFLNHEDIRMRRSHRYEFLRLRLLPFFQAHLKSLVVERVAELEAELAAANAKISRFVYELAVGTPEEVLEVQRRLAADPGDIGDHNRTIRGAADRIAELEAEVQRLKAELAGCVPRSVTDRAAKVLRSILFDAAGEGECRYCGGATADMGGAHFAECPASRLIPALEQPHHAAAEQPAPGEGER